MFDSPSWIGSFITSRTNAEIQDLNRKHDVMMEDIKHKHEMLLQESRNVNASDIAQANRESSEEIARLQRIHEENINSQKMRNAITVALINTASNVASKTLPYVLPAFAVGALNGKGKSGDGPKDTSGKGSSSASSLDTSPVSVNKKKQTAKEKADGLFPELEPTFGSTLTTIGNSKPKINVTQILPAIGAVLTMAAPLLVL